MYPLRSVVTSIPAPGKMLMTEYARQNKMYKYGDDIRNQNVLLNKNLSK